ncbi:dehydrogenase [Yersinia alsatica]|uniref:Dehydrogenase n=2 Tax=Yersinia alsatica TaxID=2890317 RepID=A0ABY5ULR9_9GAMM|nr:dehydrogenase [Yersinia alsatica]OWF68107.1 dehydrogenase [Yersinia frederiksenii]UWM44421.1 dehydrogenase [Yersinia alsatica]CNK84134.1 GHMP kinase [Yersinia frederiksenii]CNK92198.1 GHMP kinase [Yersinia frederiksenii]
MLYNKKIARSRAPLRLGLAGGGTDISPYCDEYTGYVLNATIDRYTYCTIESSNEKQVTFTANDQNKSVTFNIDEYPFQIDGDLILLKATYNKIIREFNNNVPFPLKMTTFCDSPVGSGLGTSSCLVVAIIKAFEEYLSIGFDDYQIAHLAYEIERIDCRLEGGRQDQYSATFGGFNFIEFYNQNEVLVNPLRIRNWIRSELESSLLLHYTGKSRSSAEVISDQVKSFTNKNTNCLDNMHHIKESALHMKESILRGDFDTFVDIMRAAWDMKKNSSAKVSTPEIDNYIERAIKAGALCAKVSGAGGGGFIMYFVPPEYRNNVIKVISDANSWVSNCHFTTEGSQCWTAR